MDAVLVGHGCSLLRTDFTMNVITLGPWMLSSQNRLEHGDHHVWDMDALFSERNKPWTSSWLGHRCCLLRTNSPQRQVSKTENAKNQGIRNSKKIVNTERSRQLQYRWAKTPKTRVLNTKQVKKKKAKISVNICKAPATKAEGIKNSMKRKRIAEQKKGWRQVSRLARTTVRCNP